LGSTGMSISKHYCGASLKSISINLSTDNCCDTPMNCCHNEKLTIKIEDDFAINSCTYNFNCLGYDLDVLAEGFDDVQFVEHSLVAFTKVIPPPKIQKALSLMQSYLL